MDVDPDLVLDPDLVQDKVATPCSRFAISYFVTAGFTFHSTKMQS